MPFTHQTVTISGSLLKPGWRDRMMASIKRSVDGELEVIRKDMAQMARPYADTGSYAIGFIARSRTTGHLTLQGDVYNQSQSPTWHGIRNIVQHVIETGRIPGGKMPPVGALIPWMRRHGIPDDREFLVRRKIARDGTKPRHIFRQGFDHAEARFGPFKVRLRSNLVRDLQR